MQTSFNGSQKPEDAGSAFNAMNAAIRRVLSLMGTAMPVQVVAVQGQGLNPVGMVDVRPMVHQQDGAGRVTPRGVIHGVPYIRLQGGARAIICDPEVGDIGFILVSGRDISNVKSTRAPAAPGSFRQHDLADAVYIGGLLNAAPSEYIGWVDGNVHVKTAGTFVVEAASMQVSGDIVCDGDVKAGSISLKAHTHGGVQSGSASTGVPQ